jgi:hypothetical protein
MLQNSMRFINRQDELRRLKALEQRAEGQLAVVFGRRRVGKTRLLVEWTQHSGGLYTVADQSTAEVQRRYLAGELASVFAGFADVDYPDWSSLFNRLAREARAIGWKGPLVLDELPYLALAAPEIASVLQRFVDHEGRGAGIKLALAGSSQRMMQGLALAASAPLYGRAQALFEVKPLHARELCAAFGDREVPDLIRLYTAWGGIPRYWELALTAGDDVEAQVDALVLDPLGPLCSEPERLLLEELPPAVELRPILDAIGQGAHRVSEIAGRIGRPATSLARALTRLQELGLVRRETPYGEPEHSSKRSVYRLDDPFARLWFRVVAPHRARLVAGKRRERLAILRSHWSALTSLAWEELSRTLITELDRRTALAKLGPWRAGSRWWHGNAPEWDLISDSEDGQRVLVVEVKYSERPFSRRDLQRLVRETSSRTLPPSVQQRGTEAIVRAVVVPTIEADIPRILDGVHIVTGEHLFNRVR